MGRPPETPGKPRSVAVTVKLTEDGAAELDRLRGESPRPEFLRNLLVGYSQVRRQAEREAEQQRLRAQIVAPKARTYGKGKR